jgi:hypothetical protein
MVVKFKDLSMSLKTLVVLGWIIAGLCCFSFLLGFTYGYLFL